MPEYGSDRDRVRSYATGQGAGKRNDAKEQTPEEAATERVFRLRQEAESTRTRASKLSAIIWREEWRTEHATLKARHTTLATDLEERALDAKMSERAQEHYTAATKELGDIATALENANEPSRPVPPVSGEEAIEPLIINRGAVPDDVLAWVAGLGASERRALAERVRGVQNGGVDRKDGFAVGLANYLAGTRITREFYGVAENPRRFNRAAYEKARASATAAANAQTSVRGAGGGANAAAPTGKVVDQALPVAGMATSRATAEATASGGGDALPRDDRAETEGALGAAPLSDPSELLYRAEREPSFGETMDRAVADGGEVPYRAEMEQAFGQDFGSVRAKVGSSAALGEMGAIGAARGEEIAFASPSPDRSVVAHELAHVAQGRRNSSCGASTAVEDSSSRAEQEAEHAGARVAAGERAPQVTQVPKGLVARALPRNSPPPPAQVNAGEWIDRMLVLSPLRTEVASQLAGARLPVVHPRLTWNPAGSLRQRVWSSIGNAARLQLVVAPFDILARIDRVRELGEHNGKVNVGPLSYVPEVAAIIAREIENALDHCVQRLGPRLVAGYDASLDPSAGRPAARDAATLPPNSIVVSHPLDRVVEDVIRRGSIATVRPRVPTEDEPAADRMVPGALRPVTYHWVDDPALWNWIRTEPADATPEEVAKQVLGSTARAYEIHGSAPFFALPAGHVKRIAPERTKPAALKASAAMNKPGFLDAAEELEHGVSETALARSKIGEQAALAQAEHAGDLAPAAKGNDAADLAARCQAQVHLIADSYPQLGAGPKLAAMAARLAGRTKRLQTMPAADYARFGKLFAEQSSVLYAVAGDLETLATQAKKLQLASGATAPIDPTLAEIAALVLEAGAASDLPETARKQLALAHARHAAIPFDVMEAMLDDARARTMATDSLAEQWGPGESGSTKTSPPMTGRQQWQDLRSRETKLSGDVLAARRAHDAGTEKAGATRTLAERTRALQVEARIVAAETQCWYIGDKLYEQEGIVATVAGQMHDLQNARNGLRSLANTMAGIRIRWRENHAQLFALVESGATAEADPATAIRHAIAELEAELVQVGDDKTKAALEIAVSELKDMAVARAVADIAIMIGLTLITGGLGSAASGVARGLGLGRTAAQLVNVATQSVAMATLRTMLYHDSFSSAFGSELLTNFAGLAALRGVAAGLSKLKLGKALAVLKQGGGAWKYAAHGTELTVEAITQAGIMFAVAQAESLVRQGRTLNDDELKMLAIQGIGMFIGNAIAHRLTSPAMDAIAGYAAKVGAPYRRAQVRKLAEEVGRTGDAETSKELLREERALIAEELAVLQQISRDPTARAQFGEQTLATVTDQARHHVGELTGLGVEHALQSGLTEISPGKAWEGSTNQVAPALADARAAGASVHHEQLGDGTRCHIVTAGTNHYTVYERGSGPAPDSIRGATEHARARLTELEGRPGSQVNLPANPADARLLEAAQTAAGHGAPASRVLNELHDRLPAQQQKALETFRRKANDAQALTAIEGAVTRQDLAQFLGEKLLSPAVRDHLRDAIFAARAELARARLVELGVAGDGLVQSRVRQDAARVVRDLKSSGALKDEQVADVIAHADVTEIVGDLGEAIARVQLHADAARKPGQSVLSNIEIVKQVKEFSTIKEWQQAQRKHGKSVTPSGLYEADGKLWKSITEVDNIVVERGAKGGLRPVILEQVKTGAGDSPSDAGRQNIRALEGLKSIQAGSTDVAIYDRASKNKLGAQRTGELDLSQLGEVEVDGLKTRGLPGKGFDTALDLGGTAMNAGGSRTVLEQLARDLLGERVVQLVKLTHGASR